MFQPATEKTNFVAFEPDNFHEIVKSSQAQKTKYLTKWRVNLQEIYGRIAQLLLEN